MLYNAIASKKVVSYFPIDAYYECNCIFSNLHFDHIKNTNRDYWLLLYTLSVWHKNNLFAHDYNILYYIVLSVKNKNIIAEVVVTWRQYHGHRSKIFEWGFIVKQQNDFKIYTNISYYIITSFVHVYQYNHTLILQYYKKKQCSYF